MCKCTNLMRITPRMYQCVVCGIGFLCFNENNSKFIDLSEYLDYFEKPASNSAFPVASAPLPDKVTPVSHPDTQNPEGRANQS